MNKKKIVYEIRQICEEVRKKPYEMTSLELCQCNVPAFTPDIKKKLEQFIILAHLSLTDCGISSLYDMPNYHDLEYLYLTANKISDSEVCYLVKYRKLRVLGLAENNISKLDVFKEFRKFINLEDLELENNPVSYLEEYRETAFQVVEALRSLDGYDIEGKAIGEESDYSEDIIEEEEESDSDENSVKPKKKKKAAKKEQFKFDSDDLDSESYESLPPNFVKTKR